MTGWSPDPYGEGPVDPYAGRPAPNYGPNYGASPGPGYGPNAGPSSGPGYGPGYPPPGAPPPPGYPQQYPQPPSWEFAPYVPRTSLPGVGVAGIVFGFVAGVLLLLASLLLIIGASVVAGFGDDTGYSGTQFGLAAFGDLIAAGLLIVGGVLVPLRRPAGRLLITAAAALTLVMAGFWGWRFGVADTAFWSILFVGLTLTPTALVWQPAVEQWLAGGRAAPGVYPGPYGR